MKISIHALLAESDRIKFKLDFVNQEFLSTLSLRRATGLGVGLYLTTEISIHALLAESDRLCTILYSCPGNFYPRSPCGERLIQPKNTPKTRKFLSTLSLRRATSMRIDTGNSTGEFLSTLSLRRATAQDILTALNNIFLSTLSLRRATLLHCFFALCYSISIHALLAESDNIPPDSVLIIDISIHALLAESDWSADHSQNYAYNFYPRSPCGERRHHWPFAFS